MSAADKLIPRLDGVREGRARPGRARSWAALCPAHDDKHPSLDIDQLDDRLLLCCRAGCSAGDVVAAAGLELSDLFDRPTEQYRPGVHSPLRPRIDAAELLVALDHELLVGALLLLREGAHRPLTDAERDRLTLAAQRVSRAVMAVSSLREAPEMRCLRRGEGQAA